MPPHPISFGSSARTSGSKDIPLTPARKIAPPESFFPVSNAWTTLYAAFLWPKK
jgi:hypothetical protein